MVSRPTRPRPDAHRAARQLDPHVPLGGTKRSKVRRGGGFGGPNVARQSLLPGWVMMAGFVVLLLLLWTVWVSIGSRTLQEIANRPARIPTETAQQPSTVRYLVPGEGGNTSHLGPVFAILDNVELTLPAPSPRILWHASHEVSSMALAPQGDRVVAAQPMQAPQTGIVPPYVVNEDPQSVRPVTGAATVLIQPGANLVAPVSGTVTAITQDETTQTYTVVVSVQGRRDLDAVIAGLAVTPLVPGFTISSGETVIGRADARAWPDLANPGGFAGMTIDLRPST
ncbi:hypothetical protein [Stomatohabitans albus]|uniref:hypothetical protein n=1 Tax=Stomatohabitans albus TaxID=3110766 RepID=UPI00300D9636